MLVKMFNLMQPDVAFFGEKDYQQLVIVLYGRGIDFMPWPSNRWQRFATATGWP
ncbi:MAG: pantoate--beta-alanine ligase [Vampirovibrionales bacterium]